MTSIYVLGEYILRKGLLMMMKTRSRIMALATEGMKVAKTASRDVESSFFEGVLLVSGSYHG